ncbi:MAG: hypothetical protein H0W64_02820 [Gammaproteobacteria bacterium]|nr:hypothetical protein [Gammaproteobacteria bacterium]
MIKNVLISFFVLLVSGCAYERNFRGIPEPTWKQLALEQKQLIVDQSFEEEISSPIV